MRTLIVGAGATGGYLGAKLIAAGRDVTFLVRERSAARLGAEGIRVRTGDGTTTATPASAITGPALHETFDIVIVAIRGEAIAPAIETFASFVGDETTIVPIANGMDHLDVLLARFGAGRVSGGVARLAVSLDESGVVDEIQPGAALEIGPLGGSPGYTVAAVAAELDVEGLVSTVSADILAAMWVKFAFITSTAALTCLLREVIGPIARNQQGTAVAEAILDEVMSTTAAEGHPLTTGSQDVLRATLSDEDSRFAPSMYRDLVGGRLVESDVLDEMAARARHRGVDAPYVLAASATLALHNQRVAARA